MALQSPLIDNEPLPEEFPPPLEFLTADFIHPDNQAIADREAMRWRLLGRFERWQLKRYVRSLAKELRDAGYNDLVVERRQLYHDYRVALNEYKTTTFINDEARQQAREPIVAIVEQAKAAKREFDALKEPHALFDHYWGWLEYEQTHRAELKEEARREAKIRRDMRKETRWIETLIRDVWRNTKGCHYSYKSDNGREWTKVPRIELRSVRPDAHYMWIAASKRYPILGWRWLLPRHVSTTRLAEPDVLADVSAALKGRQVDVVYNIYGQMAYRVSRLDHADALPKLANWRDAMRYLPDDNDSFVYPVGITEGRKWRYASLKRKPHLLVGGKTQGGKSNFVNCVVATLASRNSPSELRFVFIDGKGGIEGAHWQALPHLLWDIVKTIEQVIPTLDQIVTIMRHRMELLEKIKAKDMDAYNSRVDIAERLARVVVIIDEMAIFVGLGKDTDKIHDLIMLITSQGRAVGVHAIAATQFPEVKIIPNRIKTNMDQRIAFPVPSNDASKVILDNIEAARLPEIPGRAANNEGMRTIFIQTPRIYDEDIAGVVSASNLAYRDVSNDLNDAENTPKITIWDEQQVLEKSLEWLRGQVSGDKLHEMLGGESPGQRHLRKMCRQLLDREKAQGYIEGKDHKRYKVKRDGRAYKLIEIEPVDKDDEDENDTPEIAP